MQAPPNPISPPLAEDLASDQNRLGTWPIGLLVVVALRILDAIAMAAIGLGITGVPVSGLPILANAPTLTRMIELVWATGTIVGVVGLLAKRRWGWVLTMVLVGLGLLAQLIRVAIGQPDHLALLLLVISAIYLNQRSVRTMARQYLDDDVA